MDNIPDHIRLMADGEFYANAYGLTQKIPEDMPLSELTDAVDELDDIGYTLDRITDRISFLADRASLTLRAPITGAGETRYIRVIRTEWCGPRDGPQEFVIELRENGSGGFMSEPDQVEEPVTWHDVEIDYDLDSDRQYTK